MDTALQWLSSYVSDRGFSVKIGNSFSQTHKIKLTAPQGNTDPVLFSCYASTLPEFIKQTTDTTIVGYADHHTFNQAFTQKTTLK